MSDDKDANATAAPLAQTAAVDTPAVRELLGRMTVTLGTLDQTFRTLNEQSAQVSALGPTMESAVEQITALRKQIRGQEAKQRERVDSIKHFLKEELKAKAADEMKDSIRESIRAEVAKEVQAQMRAQMHEHLPVPLEAQARESREQLAEVQYALKNSEARRQNSNLRPSPSNLADPLAVVVKPDGSQSALYPTDLRSLFSYDDAKARELIKDYGLHDHGVLERNLNRFMAHIGIRFELVPYTATGAAATTPRTKVPDARAAKSAK
ncbi:hypothetical protein C8Q74DRAFT_1262046 [Fomes fomentarius]|nr:hypothetical protein C8Q74DRAFT_1262046 [Fomes fomentarius]